MLKAEFRQIQDVLLDIVCVCVCGVGVISIKAYWLIYWCVASAFFMAQSAKKPMRQQTLYTLRTFWKDQQPSSEQKRMHEDRT